MIAIIKHKKLICIRGRDNMFIRAEEIVTRECLGQMFTRVTFRADELCKYNTPYLNLFTFCLMHDLLKKAEGREAYVPNIAVIDLRESEDEKKNETVREICRRYKIDII